MVTGRRVGFGLISIRGLTPRRHDAILIKGRGKQDRQAPRCAVGSGLDIENPPHLKIGDGGFGGFAREAGTPVQIRSCSRRRGSGHVCTDQGGQDAPGRGGRVGERLIGGGIRLSV